MSHHPLQHDGQLIPCSPAPRGTVAPNVHCCILQAWGSCRRSPLGKGAFVTPRNALASTMGLLLSAPAKFQVLGIGSDGGSLHWFLLHIHPGMPAPSHVPVPPGAYLFATGWRGIFSSVGRDSQLPPPRAACSPGAANVLYSTFVTPSASTELLGLGPKRIGTANPCAWVLQSCKCIEGTILTLSKTHCSCAPGNSYLQSTWEKVD